jgi:hypothetical protein
MFLLKAMAEFDCRTIYGFKRREPALVAAPASIVAGSYRRRLCLQIPKCQTCPFPRLIAKFPNYGLACRSNFCIRLNASRIIVMDRMMNRVEH